MKLSKNTTNKVFDIIENVFFFSAKLIANVIGRLQTTLGYLNVVDVIGLLLYPVPFSLNTLSSVCFFCNFDNIYTTYTHNIDT